MSGTERSSSGGLPGTTFFSKTYDEALGLVVEARDYVRDCANADAGALSLAERNLLASESLRLTTRLTEAMAWLMMQRALHAGEITPRDVCLQANRPAGGRICLGQGGVGVERLPPRLRGLLERSERLYRRVLRLDELVTRDLG